jgi:hypothetical protein
MGVVAVMEEENAMALMKALWNVTEERPALRRVLAGEV